MILYAAHAQTRMTKSFDRAVMQRTLRHFGTVRQTRFINRIAVILRRHRNLARRHVQHGMIPAAMAKRQLDRTSAERQCKQLMPHADAEHRHAAEQLAQGVRRPRGIGRVAMISCAVAVAGTTVTRQSCAANSSSIWRLTPQSTTVTRWAPSPTA